MNRKLLAAMLCMTVTVGHVASVSAQLLRAGEKRVVLNSNVDETTFLQRRFRVDQPDDEGWQEIGRGRIVNASLSSNGKLELEARAPGFRTKRRTVSDPDPVYTFSFLEDDRLPVRESPPSLPNKGITVPTTPVSTAPGERWAVIVGISEYEFHDPRQDGFANLKYADDDAEAFQAVLLALQWNPEHIKLLTNEHATKADLEWALEDWLGQAGKESTIVVFWSGHGWPAFDDSNRVYFACHDSNRNRPSTSLQMDKVKRAIEDRNPRNVVLVADTCHAGSVVVKGASDPNKKGILPAIKDMQAHPTVSKGWVFFTPGDADRETTEREKWKHGALTYSVLAGLREQGGADGAGGGPRDGVITVGELRDFVEQYMPKITFDELGTALKPLITTNSAHREIWNLTLQAK